MDKVKLVSVYISKKSFFILVILTLILSQLSFVISSYALGGSTTSGVVKYVNGTNEFFQDPSGSNYIQLFNGSFSGSNNPNATGNYAINDMPDGSYRVRIWNSDSNNNSLPTLQNLTSINSPVTVSGSNVTRDVTFNMSSVTVTVKGSSGNIIPNTDITLSSIGQSTFTDSSGEIQFQTPTSINNGVISNSIATGSNGVGVVPILSNVNYSICTTYNNKQYCVPNQVVTQDVSFEITIPDSVVSGVYKFVHGSDTFYPDPTNSSKPSIQIFNSGFSGSSNSNISGNYSIANVPDGSYRVRAYANDSNNDSLPTLQNLTSVNSPTVVSGTNKTQDISLGLSYVTVTVKDSNGNILPSADVVLSSKGQSTFTDTSGEIQFQTPTSFNNGVISNSITTDNNGVAQVPILSGVFYSICAYKNSSQKCLDNQTINSDVNLEISFANATYSGAFSFKHGTTTYYPNVSTSDKPYVQLFNQVFSGLNYLNNTGQYSITNMPNGDFSAKIYSPDSNADNLPRLDNLTSTNTPFSIVNQVNATKDISLDLSFVSVTVKDVSGNLVTGSNVFITSYGQSTFTDSSGTINFQTPTTQNNQMITNNINTDSNGVALVPVLSGVFYSICAGIDTNIYCSSNQTITGDTSVFIQPKPDTPLNLQASSPTEQPVLSWGSSPGATSYNVYRDSVNIGTTSSTTFTDTTATPGTYTYYVTAVNEAGESGQSNSVVVIVEMNQPQTFTLSPSEDTYLLGGATNRNHGADTEINIQSSGNNRGLVSFDQSSINSTVGSGTIISATLRLTIMSSSNSWGSGRTVDLHRMLVDWSEGNGTASDRGTGSGATWDCATDSAIQNQSKDCSGVNVWEMGQPNNPSVHPWFESPSATQTIYSNQSGVVQYDVTNDIQDFLDGDYDNYGWIIKKTNEGQSGQVSFGTKESSYGAQLEITYQP